MLVNSPMSTSIFMRLISRQESTVGLRVACLLQPSPPWPSGIGSRVNSCADAFRRGGRKLNCLVDLARKAIPILLLAFFGVARAGAQQADVKQSPNFARVVTPFVQQYCIECHGEKRQKGKLSLAGLTGDLAKPRELQVWRAVYDALEAREMPPSDAKTRPAEPEFAPVMQSLATAMRAAG